MREAWRQGGREAEREEDRREDDEKRGATSRPGRCSRPTGLLQTGLGGAPRAPPRHCPTLSLRMYCSAIQMTPTLLASRVRGLGFGVRRLGFSVQG